MARQLEPTTPTEAESLPLADRLREARLSNGWTPDEAASKLGVAVTTVIRWESGTLRPPREMVESIAKLLGVDVDDLETNAATIPRLRTVSGTPDEQTNLLREGSARSFRCNGNSWTAEFPPYVVNGPPDQQPFHDALVSMQEHSRAIENSAQYARRLSLVATVDGEPTAQAQLERPRPRAVSWGSNYGSHGWHRYVGRFPPHLVRALLNSFGADSRSLVCDPFAGSGTTLVECRLLGIPATGVEISPLSALISETKACFPASSDAVQRAAGNLDAFFAESQLASTAKRVTHEDVLSRDGNLVPAFPNFARWFTPEALLGVSLTAEFASSLTGYERMAVVTALSAKMRSIGNVDVDVVRAEYRKEPREGVDVRRLVVRHLQKMARDIDASLKTHEGLIGQPDSVSVLHGNVLDAAIEPGSVTHIITSPPYGVESLSYFRTHLLSFRSLESFLGQDPYAVGKDVIGSEYLDGDPEEISVAQAKSSRTYTQHFDESALASLSKNERRRTMMMMKFFDDMTSVAARFREWLTPGGRVAFVIGNKKLGDRVIPTADIVEELFADQGLVLERTISHKLKTNNSNSVVPWQERIINDEYVLIFRLH